MDWHRAIKENGFGILPEVFSSQFINSQLAQIEELGSQRSRAGIRHALRFSPVASLAAQPEMIEIARTILGPRAYPFRATLFDKSSEANWLVVWHQDTALPLQSRLDISGWGPWSVKEGMHYAHAPASALDQVLALRVSLDDSTTANGPLRVLPRTHRFGVLTDDQVHDLAASSASVECVVPKGGILAMRPLLVHASSKSHSDAPRRVLHIEYAASDSIAIPLQLAVA